MSLYFHPRQKYNVYSVFENLRDNLSEVFDEKLLFLHARAILAFCLQTGLKIDLALIVPVKNDIVSKVIKFIFKCEHPVPEALHKFGVKHRGDCYLYINFSDLRFICKSARLYRPAHVRAERGRNWCSILELSLTAKQVNPTLPGHLAAMLL